MLYISTESTPNIIGLSETVQDCVNKGIKLNDTTVLENQIRTEYDKALRTLRNVYGIDNPNSSKQVIDAFRELASTTTPEIANVCYDEKKDKWSTKADNLTELIMLNIPIAITLANYRTLNNVLSTIQSFRLLKDRNDCVHPLVSYGRTGRINYKEPALMNINKKVLWNIVTARDEDCVLYSIDIKNQEPWILINMLDIEGLKDSLNPEKGLYESIYKLWYGKDFDDKVERSEFKRSWNALTYGASKYGIDRICKHIDSDIIYHNFNHIEELKAYRKDCTSKGFKNVKYCKTIFGRELTCDAPKGMALARQHMDYPIQGTGVDILAFLNDNLFDKCEELGYSEMIKPYYFRHDECIIQVNEGIIDFLGQEKFEEFLRDTFEHQIDNWVPFNVEISEVKPTTDLNELLKEE